MNQMAPPMQQGHYMGMNPMHSGPLPTSGAPPPVGGFPNNMPNMQGPPNASSGQMYPQGGGFNRPQMPQMPMMPGYNPYQVRQKSLLLQGSISGIADMDISCTSLCDQKGVFESYF